MKYKIKGRIFVMTDDLADVVLTEYKKDVQIVTMRMPYEQWPIFKEKHHAERIED